MSLSPTVMMPVPGAPSANLNKVSDDQSDEDQHDATVEEESVEVGAGLTKPFPSFKITSGRVVWGPTATAIEGAVNATKIPQHEPAARSSETPATSASASSASASSSSSSTTTAPTQPRPPRLNGPQSLRAAEPLPGGTILQREHCYVSRAAVGEWKSTPISVSWEVRQELPPDDYVVVEPITRNAGFGNEGVDANGTPVVLGWGTWQRKRDPLPPIYKWGFPQVVLLYHESQDPIELTLRVQKFGMYGEQNDENDPAIVYINRYDWGHHHHLPDSVKTILAQGGLFTPSSFHEWMGDRSDFCFLDADGAVETLKGLLKDVPKEEETKKERNTGAVRLLGAKIARPLSQPAVVESTDGQGLLVQIPGREYELGWLIFDSGEEDAKLIGVLYDTYSSFSTDEMVGLKVGETVVHSFESIAPRAAAQKAEYEERKQKMIEENTQTIQTWFDEIRKDPARLENKEQLGRDFAKIRNDGTLGKGYYLDESIEKLSLISKDIYEPLFDIYDASHGFGNIATDMKEQQKQREEQVASERKQLVALLTELGVPRASSDQVPPPTRGWNAPRPPLTHDESQLRRVIEGLQKSGIKLFQCWYLLDQPKSLSSFTDAELTAKKPSKDVSEAPTAASSSTPAELPFDPFWIQDLDTMLQRMAKDEEERMEDRAKALVEKVNQARKASGEPELFYQTKESMTPAGGASFEENFTRGEEQRVKKQETLMYACMHDYRSKTLPQLAELMVSVGLYSIEDMLHFWAQHDPNLQELYGLVRTEYRALQNKLGRQVF